VHCIGGILGALLTGFFNDPKLGGTGVMDYVANKVGDFSLSTQMIAQLWGVVVTLVWSGVVAYAAYKIVDLTIGLRISEDKEREGLDTTEHGEHAYND
jgi:Amt family ammonium transporter